jgi:U6 snRNA-associated Sm-like protein LSm8
MAADAGSIRSLEGQQVLVVTNDGRTFVGILRGSDHTMNMVLADASERVFSPNAPVEVVALGAYVIRGEHVTLVAELDIGKELSIDLSTVRAPRIKPVVH